MKYKAVLWDWNGTLIDDAAAACDTVNDMQRENGAPEIDMERYYTLVDTPIKKFYTGLLGREDIDFPAISESFHSGYDSRLMQIELMDGAEEILALCKSSGIVSVIVSASHTDEVNSLLKRYGIDGYFMRVLGADNNFAESKTGRTVRFFSELGIDKSEALFVGDTLHDYDTAEALGIDCALISGGHQGRKILETTGAYVFDNLSELKDILISGVPERQLIDLHTHSIMSDGSLTPRELVRHAKEKGLSAVALTDHDCVSGVSEAEAAGKEFGIEVIPGIEFSVSSETETHILGYNTDIGNSELIEAIAETVASRNARMAETSEKLAALGFDISVNDAAALAPNGIVGRAHFARVMLERGTVSSVKEAFDKYLAFGMPAYSSRHSLTAERAIHVINAAGGRAFLAHLHLIKKSDRDLFEFLRELKGCGLYGIEGYYTDYTEEMNVKYRSMAKQLGLRLSGGTDYHGAMKPHIEIGEGTGKLRIPASLLKNIK